MAIAVNKILQGANVMGKTVAKYATEMAGAGITTRMIESAAADLADKDTKQKQSVNLTAQKTALQNQIMREGMNAINKIQNGAKSGFEKNKTILKAFHIGTDKPKTVKGMTRELEYIQDTATTHQDVLKKNGITDADIARLGTIAVNLKEADGEQEQAKKLQMNATADRD